MVRWVHLILSRCRVSCGHSSRIDGYWQSIEQATSPSPMAIHLATGLKQRFFRSDATHTTTADVIWRVARSLFCGRFLKCLRIFLYQRGILLIVRYLLCRSAEFAIPALHFMLIHSSRLSLFLVVFSPMKLSRVIINAANETASSFYWGVHSGSVQTTRTNSEIIRFYECRPLSLRKSVYGIGTHVCIEANTESALQRSSQFLSVRNP